VEPVTSPKEVAAVDKVQRLYNRILLKYEEKINLVKSGARWILRVVALLLYLPLYMYHQRRDR
jgi:hypothetical protein